MASAFIVPPATFVEHATRIRAARLERIAGEVENELRIRLVSMKETAKTPPKGKLVTVFKHFRGRLR